MESSSERQRMVNPRKAYPVDPGLIPVFDRSGRANLGHALETAVLIELERRRFDVTYVRTPQGYEVDFLARGADRAPELLQVCADLSDAAVAERELRALMAAGEQFPGAVRRLLTLDRDDIPSTPPDGVIVETAWEWMAELPMRLADGYRSVPPQGFNHRTGLVAEPRESRTGIAKKLRIRTGKQSLEALAESLTRSLRRKCAEPRHGLVPSPDHNGKRLDLVSVNPRYPPVTLLDLVGPGVSRTCRCQRSVPLRGRETARNIQKSPFGVL